MLDPRALYEYSLSLGDTFEGQELQHRLRLFQIFSKLYEQHQDLLDEILALDSHSSRPSKAQGLFTYIQAMVIGNRAHLMTNLMDGRSQTLTQAQQIWTIGRDSQQVVISIRDKRLSRRHAAIHYSQQEFRLIDLGSTNGSFVNGERIRDQYPLRDGDRIRLGSMTFSFFICQNWKELPPVSEADVQQLQNASLSSTQLREPEHQASESEVDIGGAIPAFVLEETLEFIRNRDRQ